MFFGSIPALVTPFAAGRVAEDTFRDFVEWQIAEGSRTRWCRAARPAKRDPRPRRAPRGDRASRSRSAKGRVPVIAGCGSYSTAAAIELVRAAADVGADAALVVVPYYNKPSQAGLAAHFPAVAEASPLPIVVYNVPSRTVADISVETLGASRQASRRSSRSRTRPAISPGCRPSGSRAARTSSSCRGNDDMALGFNAMGGVGCISVTANVAPKLCSDFQKATREGRWDDALELQDRLYPLHAALFSATLRPAPTKYALSRVRTGFPTELGCRWSKPRTPRSARSMRRWSMPGWFSQAPASSLFSIASNRGSFRIGSNSGSTRKVFRPGH